MDNKEKDCGCGCGGHGNAKSEAVIMGWVPPESTLQ